MDATTPRERPILFSGPMVRAILAGTKTQTRRAMKPQPEHAQIYDWKGKRLRDASHRAWCWKGYVHTDTWAEPTDALRHRCPYGVAGDRLWVRETIAVHSKHCEGQGTGYFLHYRADEALRELDPDQRVTPVHDIHPHQRIADKGWRPSIHMPRWACRIVVEITDVRVQRLHDISEDDARAEGVDRIPTSSPSAPKYGMPLLDTGIGMVVDTATQAFQGLWESINGDFSWDANPWVWALTFKRVA